MKVDKMEVFHMILQFYYSYVLEICGKYDCISHILFYILRWLPKFILILR